MSVRMYQNLFNQTKDIIHKEIGLMDETGIILACSDERKIGTIAPLIISDLVWRPNNTAVLESFTYQKVIVRNKMEYIAYIASDDSEGLNYLSLIVINIANMKSYYDDKFDKINFIKNVIMDNILPGDIPLRAKELHLPYNAFRVAFLVKTGKTKDIYAHDIIQGLFPNKARDFIIILDDENTVLIKELKSSEDYKEIEKTANMIIDTINAELMVKATVGIGMVVDSIKELGRSFKEAQMALHVGGIFESDKRVINYNNLGIGRLIYQLPTTLCKLFLKEVFKNGTFDSLDAETVNTVQSFFENNLNVSETSRKLYIHRNTLVYRLEKIQKLTGLDLKTFDDAIVFKVAMLVKKYLDRNDMVI
ncbi:MAG: helix-turn-helix domain-containing protein [Clostridia bacterium]|nr:helix-turn-helix domain-containing protein [Clostridia bacterium]